MYWQFGLNSEHSLRHKSEHSDFKNMFVSGLREGHTVCACVRVCGNRWFIQAEVEFSPLSNELLTCSRSTV